MISRFFRRLVISGLDATADILDYQRVLLTNSLALAVMVFCVFLLCVSVYFELYTHLFIASITFALMLPVFWLNKKKHFIKSSFYLIHFCGLAIFLASYFAFIEERMTETENWLYAILAISVFLFDKWRMYFNFTWFFLLILLIKYLKYTVSGWEMESTFILLLINVFILSIAFFVFLSIVKWGFKRALSKLSESDEAKNKLFSIIAHDIRNPLSTFEMLMSVSEDGSMTQEQFRTYQAKVKEQFLPVKETINSMLLWSQSNLNSIQPKMKSFRIGQIINDLVLSLMPISDEKGISVNVLCQDEPVCMDKDHLKIILRNIYHNALKFSSVGGTVDVKCHQIPNCTVIEIADMGTGISDEKIEAILTGSALQSDQGTSGEKGTGIGLLLSVELLRKNKGKIDIQRIDGGGAKFILTIPNQ